MKFPEMKYERIEAESCIAFYAELTKKAQEASSAQEIFDVIEEHEKKLSYVNTMQSLAYVRNSIDTTDEFYRGEIDYYNAEGPKFSEVLLTFMAALVASPYRKDIDEHYGKLFLLNTEMAMKCFSPEIMAELAEESQLVTKYQQLMASAEIEFDGKTLNISQLGAYKENSDREVRRGAYFAEGNFYMSHAAEFDELYDSLVKVRTKIAQKLGYKNFVELGYLRMNRSSYNADMVAKFRQSVVNDIVPLNMVLKQKQAERIGIPFDEMCLYDDPYRYTEGNPKPMGTADDILAAGKKMYESMSARTGEFINFMYDNELLDVLAKPGKAVGGYCTEFSEYKAPFIFSNFNGTTGDVDVLTHEAGHAFAAFEAADSPLLETASPTYESCEVHSMSMEFLAWKWMELFYGDDADRVRFSHLEGAMNFIPYGVLVDHFQHVMYENPDMTPAERNQAWLEMEAKYRPYLNFADVPFYSEGRGWQRQSHIYMNPFYYIDYALAQIVALDVWRISREDFDKAWNQYLAFVKQAGNAVFTDLCENAGLLNPFTDGALKAIAEKAMDYLKAN